MLPRGSETKDAYRLTPDELYNLGSQLFAAEKLDQAGKHLDQLLREWHKTEFHLRDNYYKQVARMMLFVSIARRDSKSVVKFFEVLKDQYPELVIPFDKIVAVGKAYRDIGAAVAARAGLAEPARVTRVGDEVQLVSRGLESLAGHASRLARRKRIATLDQLESWLEATGPPRP